MSAPGPEEGWEAEVSALLAGLPTVEPPDGFIATALDHPPLHAGRTLVTLAGLALAAVAAVVALGIGSTGGVPSLDDLAARPMAARATIVLADDGGDDDEVDDGGGADGRAEPAAPQGMDPAAHLPAGFEPAASMPVDGVGQYVFHRGDEVVSVFVQRGPVDWSALPDGGQRRHLGDDEAWVDTGRGVAIVQDGDATVTIVGLPAGELTTRPQGEGDDERAEPAVAARLEQVVTALARQLGLVG